MNINTDFIDSDNSINFETVDSNKKKETKYYQNLYAELLDKCHPNNFTNKAPDDYDVKLVRISINLYESLMQQKTVFNVSDNKVPPSLHSLRKDAEQKLGITCSAERIFEKIKNEINPNKFSQRGNQYNQELLLLANELYGELLKVKGDVNELYNFYSRDDYLSLKSKIDNVNSNRDGNDDTDKILLLLLGAILILITSIACFCAYHLH